MPTPERAPRKTWLLPLVLAVIALGGMIFWFTRSADSLSLRVPGTDRGPEDALGTNANAVLAGKVIKGDGQPSDLPGAWPQFRGPQRDGISREATPLVRALPPGTPKELWSVEAGEGHAGPAILNGRVYLMDYDRGKKQDALRCLSLADGKEIWRFVYPVSVKRNHGMSRTVPAVTDKFVVAIGPKCHVLCVKADTGDLVWGMDLEREQGATVPPWYAGQCPLIDGDTVILAPGGTDALVMAVDLATGAIRWKTPNPRAWKMTHSSVMPMEVGGEKMYVYCGHNGVAGVAAKTGELLWETSEWKISIATVPTPIIVGDGRIFLTGGYNAGSLMLRVTHEQGKFSARAEYRLDHKVFGATQQTPILYNDHIYGVRPDGKLACLSLEGKVRWTSDASHNYGLGPFLLADGVLFVVNNSCLVRLVMAAPDKYNCLGEYQVVKGDDAWGPLAIAGGRLLVRDMHRMFCLDVVRR